MDVMHIVYPYRSETNWVSNTTSYPIHDQEDFAEFEVKNFKIFKFNILNNIDAIKTKIIENDCLFLTYFFSSPDEFIVDIFEEQGNAVNLFLGSASHDYTKENMTSNKYQLENNIEHDMTDRLYQFRMKHDFFNEHVQLNFFCPYWKENQTRSHLKGEIEFVFNEKEPVKNENENVTHLDGDKDADSVENPETLQNTDLTKNLNNTKPTGDIDPKIQNGINVSGEKPEIKKPVETQNNNNDSEIESDIVPLTLSQSVDLFNSLKNENAKTFKENIKKKLKDDKRVNNKKIEFDQSNSDILKVSIFIF